MDRAAVVMQGRDAILNDIGLETVLNEIHDPRVPAHRSLFSPQILGYLKDSSPEVRSRACDLIATVSDNGIVEFRFRLGSEFDDSHAINALVNVLNDPAESLDVVCRAVAPLAYLTEFDPELDQK
eukprot:431836-Amorphochlora_amoeboformis.AAC.4